MKRRRILALASAASTALASTGAALCTASPAVQTTVVNAAEGGMSVEYLDRGISAVNTGSGMLVSWRWLSSDSDAAVFRLYRDGTLIYTSNSGDATCFLDAGGNANSVYKVESVSGDRVLSSDTCALKSGSTYFDLPLSPPGSGYTPNDCSVGDVDGDGVYEIFLKWDPNNSKDNSQSGVTGNVYIDCLKLNGTRLWRIDLGVNIRAGAHYTQFYVADFDLDGRAEMTCKTADGTKDGTGKVIGDGSKDYRNSSGYILSGPEYYTLFDGATGAALDTVNYEPARGTVAKSTWGDDYGNRVDRFWGTVAYLDGVHPSVVTGRGYYTRMTATAYSVENKKLKKLWAFDTGFNSSAAGYGDGNHNSMAADVDGDGRQEILTGATCIDDNGTVKWCLNTGHGDAMHVGDLDPSNPGLEEWICHEDKGCGYGVSLVDCDTGKTLYHENGAGDTGRCCADNVWDGNPGAECWGNKNSANETPVISATTQQVLNCRRPSINFLSYWDGDLERELLDGATDSPATISKMTGAAGKTTITNLLTTTGFYTCNTTKGTPCLSADIFGDWREELIVRAADAKSIRIYCTPYDTKYRITTLMHDPQYRTQVSAQNTAYNQPPHPSFYLGSDQPLPARPVNSVSVSSTLPGAAFDTNETYVIKNAGSGLFLAAEGNKAENGTNVIQSSTETTWTLKSAGSGYYYIIAGVGDGTSHYLDIDYGQTDNGTNIGLWTDTASDAQLFKFVDNGDGTYLITTKVTADASGIGITGGSAEEGANVIEWTLDGSANQRWTVEMKIVPLEGRLISGLLVYDRANAANWSIDSAANDGDLLYNDRDVTYVGLPDALKGAEAITVACDSKNTTTELASFTAAQDMTVYVALDDRVTTVPAWMSGYQKTAYTFANNNDVTYTAYAKEVKAGEQVTLGTNGQSSGCVQYVVFAQENATQVTETTTTTASTETTTTTASTEPGGATVWGDADCNGLFELSDCVLLAKATAGIEGSTLTAKGKSNCDLYADNSLSGKDLQIVLQLMAGIYDNSQMPIQP